MQLDTSTKKKAGSVHHQDFKAVIPVGYGENLYPLNQGTHVVTKALLPIGNVPVINLVLDWVLESGLRDILLIVPPAYYTPISNHISQSYSLVAHPKARIEIKRYTEGEDDEDDDQGGMLSEGTARLLKRFRSSIKTDFVLLPCDLAPPKSLKLTSVLDKHRQSPDAVLTSVFYEPVEPVKEAGEKLLVAMDKHSSELLLVQPVDANEDDVSIRTALIRKHPSISLTTRLQDAHIYVMRRTFLDLLASRRAKDLDSLREQVIPWLIKTAWQKGLAQRYSPILDPSRRDPLASALARSSARRGTKGEFVEDLSESTNKSLSNSGFLPSPTSRSPEPRAQWGIQPVKSGYKCQIVITAPVIVEPVPIPKGSKEKPKPPPEPDHLIRANSLAGYWELNRRFIKSLSPSSQGQGHGQAQGQSALSKSTSSSATEEKSQISALAQISPDSLIHETTRVGDKASIKKCVIGRHCVIGKGAKLTGCILWDFVVIEENAKIENTILCSNARIGAKAQIKDCEFGTGFEAKAEAVLKGERLIAGQVA